MPKYKIFAAIDLGSTAITMKIVQITKKEGFSVLETLKYGISIGSQTYKVGKISYDVVDEICLCLKQCVEKMKEYGAEDYICYATTAVREASNSEYIIDQINIRCNLKVSIISNEEESFLAYKAFAFNCADFDDIISDSAVFVDVSSGNTRVSYYKNSALFFSQKMKIGSLRVLELLSGVKNNTIGFLGLLEEYIKTWIKNEKTCFFNEKECKNFVITGINSEIIRKICKADGDKINIEKFAEVYKFLDDRETEKISEAYGISYDEAQLLFPAMLIYKTFFDELNCKNIIIPDVSVADGICVSYLEKSLITHTNHIFTNDIISSSEYYADKFGVNHNHYNKIIEFGNEIFNSISKKFGLSKKDFVLFRVAAIFADTGKYINVNDYSRYSYDIKKANPIIGLTENENTIISFIVLFSAGVFDFDDYNILPKNKKLLISKLAAILFVAQTLDVGYDGKITAIKVITKKGEMMIKAKASSDITLEKFRFIRAAGFFEEVFGIKAYLNGTV